MRTAAALVLLFAAAAAAAEPVRVFRHNPHYFERDGRPLVLVTSDHHYGAVIDADFDFVRFLDALAAGGANLTRIYPGGMFEVEDKYVPGNPLGPRPGRQILPWARSGVPGAHPALAAPGEPSYKLDLERWNPEYFARLRAFVEQAGRRGIVVEVAFFNGMYADSWPLMAFHHRNNVQGVGRYEAEECGLFTTADPRNADVLRYQRAYVAKIAAELNGFDNVIYDLCDEPSLVGRPDGSIVLQPDAAVVPWLHALRDAFLEAERPLPKRHLLGQTVQNLSPDLSAEPWCDWLPTEYVRPAGRALERNYAARKPIVDVESDYFGHSLVKSPYTEDAVRHRGLVVRARRRGRCHQPERRVPPRAGGGGRRHARGDPAAAPGAPGVRGGPRPRARLALRGRRGPAGRARAPARSRSPAGSTRSTCSTRRRSPSGARTSIRGPDATATRSRCAACPAARIGWSGSIRPRARRSRGERWTGTAATWSWPRRCTRSTSRCGCAPLPERRWASPPPSPASSSTCSASRSTTARASARPCSSRAARLRCPWCHNPESQAFAPEVPLVEAAASAAARARRPALPARRRPGVRAGCDRSAAPCVAACPTGARQIARARPERRRA